MSSFDFDEEKAAFLEEMYQSSPMVDRRATVRNAVDPTVGEDVLCIGPGPGYEPAELADRVAPGGSVTALDISESMLEMTRRRCGPESPVSVTRGLAESLPFRDDAFDIVTAVQVFEYLSDAERAVGELARVLRPGGRAAVVATDWRSLVWRTDDDERCERIMDAYSDHCADARMGSRLQALFRADPTVQITSIEPYSVLQTAVSGGAFYSHFAKLVADYVRAQDAVPAAEVDAWLADVEDRTEEAPFLSFTQYLYTVEPS